MNPSSCCRCRSGIARCAEAYEILPGAHIHLSKEGENALYIILSGSVKAEVNKKEKGWLTMLVYQAEIARTVFNNLSPSGFWTTPPLPPPLLPSHGP